MGVKGLWKYFEKHGLISTLPGKIRESEINLYDDVLHPDHLFIDMNSVMHTAYTLATKPVTTQSALVATIALLNRLLDKIYPSMTLVVVIDGVAPIAKLPTQRDRRTNLPATAPLPPPPLLLEKTKNNKKKNANAKPSSKLETSHDENSTLCNTGRKNKKNDDDENENDNCGRKHQCDNNDSSIDCATSNKSYSLLLQHQLNKFNKINEERYTCDIHSSAVTLQREEIVTGSEFVHVCTSHVIRWLKQRHARLVERQAKYMENVEMSDHEQSANSNNDNNVSGNNNTNKSKKKEKCNNCKSETRKKCNAPQVYKLIISDYMEEGEGEVKIARILRYLWRMRYADQNVQTEELLSRGENNVSNCNRGHKELGEVEDRVVIMGNDSDLAIVAMLALPFHTFTILDPCDFQILSLSELPYHWLPVKPQTTLVQLEQQQPQEKTVMSTKKMTVMYSRLCSFRVDWAFIMLLAGCDYYLGIGDIALTLWGHYRELRSLANLYYSTSLISINDEGNGCMLNVEFMRAITARSISAIMNTGHNGYNHNHNHNNNNNNNNNTKNKHKTYNGKGKRSKRRVSNKEKLCVAWQCENTKGNQSAHEGLFVLRGALIMLESYLCGNAVDFVQQTICDNDQNESNYNNREVNSITHFTSGAVWANPNQRRCVSISSIRAALQLHNINAKLNVSIKKIEHLLQQKVGGIKSNNYNKSKDNIESIATCSANTQNECSSSCTSNSISTCNNEVDTNHKNETTHEMNTCAMTKQTLPSPLAQCLAILGIRGRYSDEVRRAITACTTDNGVKLTTTSSMTFVQKVVNSICTELNVEKLTRAEAEMLQPSYTTIRALFETSGSNHNYSSVVEQPVDSKSIPCAKTNNECNKDEQCNNTDGSISVRKNLLCDDL